MKKSTPRISLFIITKNEEHHIAACILSARDIVNEVVIVDSGSTDNTLRICQDLGAVVFQRDFDGFAQQKNFALSKVTSPWALSLDADERLSPQLKEEILQTLSEPTDKEGFLLARCNYFLGKKMRFSGLDKEMHLRLVKSNKAHYEGGLVHERLVVKGPVGRLQGIIEHFSYDTLEDYFNKFNRYTSLAARQMHQNGRHFYLLKVLLTLPFEFFKRYFLKLGVLDGWRGFLWASCSTFYVFIKYAKLWQLEQKPN